MLRPLTILLVATLATGCKQVAPPPAPTVSAAPDPDQARVRAILAAEEPRVTAYFGSSMPRSYELRVFPHRSDMEAFARSTWQMPELPCWAVAMGSGSRLVVLAPSVWAGEACEHDPSDEEAMRLLLAHELVHVFHGQHRTDSEFMQADEVGWLVEGLAVAASGQLDAKRLRQAAATVASGKGPTRLTEAWSGAARYGVAGSMARFVEERIGRERMVELLDDSTNAAVLGRLGIDEEGFLTAWRSWLAQAAASLPEPSASPAASGSAAR